MGDQRRPLEQKLLEAKRYFEVVLNDGETMTCKLLHWLKYDLHVETEMGILLLPKRSIRMIILERYEDEE